MKILLGLIIVVLLIVGLRLGEIYTQLGRYQKYWSKVNDQPIKQDDLVYVAFGDSAAQGVGASKPQKGYVGLIADYLAGQSNEDIKVINLSKSGAKIRDVLDAQLPTYESLKLANKQIITIEIGANDILSFDQQKFEAEMGEMMSNLPKNAVISDIPSFKGSRLAKYEDRVVQANQIIYRLAPKYGFELAELHAQVGANHGLRTFGADLFHPSDHGYKTNWLPAFTAKIRLD